MKIIDELQSILEQVSRNAAPTLQACKEKRRTNELILSPKSINREIRDALLAAGWQRETVIFGRMAVDFSKGSVVVEIQLGKTPYMAENLHAKFPLAVKHFGATACVLVCPTQEMSRRMSHGVGCYEYCMTYYVSPILERIDYPLVVIGFDFFSNVRVGGMCPSSIPLEYVDGLHNDSDAPLQGQW